MHAAWEGVHTILLHTGVVDADLSVCTAPRRVVRRAAAGFGRAVRPRRSPTTSGIERAEVNDERARRPRSTTQAALCCGVGISRVISPGRGVARDVPGTPRQYRDLGYGLFLIWR
jgi:hypothetical protein